MEQEQTLTIEEKLIAIQGYVANICTTLTAENLAEICRRYNLALLLNDTIECKGGRYYNKTVARLIDPNCDRVIAATGEAEHLGSYKDGKKDCYDGNTEEAVATARRIALSGLFGFNM
nr:MAG TPA: hypothetical protein [Caudoviricetes sp.]